MKHFDECTKAQQIERWENVLRVLSNLTPHERRRHWDMSWWGYKTECGTVACAAGHCGLDPWFRRRGFKLDFYKSWITQDWSSSMPIEPEDFFGKVGCTTIFYNETRRSVGTVIREVRAYLKQLRGMPGNE